MCVTGLLKKKKSILLTREHPYCRNCLEENINPEQGPGAEKFFDAPAPAPLLLNKLWLLRLQLQIGSSNFTFQFEMLIRNIYFKNER